MGQSSLPTRLTLGYTNLINRMTDKSQKPRFGVIFLALIFLLYSVLITGSGITILREWSAISRSLALCGALWTLSGPAMALGALWLLASLGRSFRALRIGGSGTVVAGFVMLSAELIHVLPCTGAA